MTDAAPEIDLRPDGTVTLTLPSGKVTLRRPTIGELRSLEEALEQANDTVRDASLSVPNDLPPQPRRAADEGEDAFASRVAAYQQERDAVREVLREFKAESQSRYVGWFRQVVGTIGSGAALPDNDTELPPWASAVTLGAALLAHWGQTPLPVATR